jgi:hypothetical protein
MNLRIQVAIAVLLLGLILVTGLTKTWAELASMPATPSAATPLVPDYVLWESVFRLDLSFRRKALDQKLSGETATDLKTYFKDEIGLTPEQDTILRETAIEYLGALQPINAQAVDLIAVLRKSFPDGWVRDGQEAPPPPQALLDLQGKRNALALTYRDRLANRLGSKAFEQFDDFVKGKFAKNFQSIGPEKAK